MKEEEGEGSELGGRFYVRREAKENNERGRERKRGRNVMHEERGSSKRVRYRRTNRGELVTRLVTRRDPRWGEGGVVARSCVPCSTLVSVRTTRQREEGWPEARIEEWREKRLVQAARQAGRQAGRPGRGLVVKLHAANV